MIPTSTTNAMTRLNESRETYFRNRDLPSADRNNEPDSDDDDLLENTDTEDGLLSQHSRDIARLRDKDVFELLRTNTHLVALLSTQRKTIARLRARINRLGTLIPQLPSHDIGDSNTMMEAAFILTDSLASTPEVTLSSIGSKFNPEIHLNFLMNKKVLQEI
jgi:hypothetical protein